MNLTTNHDTIFGSVAKIRLSAVSQNANNPSFWVCRDFWSSFAAPCSISVVAARLILPNQPFALLARQWIPRSMLLRFLATARD